ncbi:hypothetical protein SAMN06295937_10851, partial [Sphingopyxis flava]
SGYALPAVSGRRHSGRLLLRPVAGFYSAVDRVDGTEFEWGKQPA